MSQRSVSACRLVVLAAGVVAWSAASSAAQDIARVDQRPIHIEIEPAFPNLAWADRLTGASRGLSIDLRLLLLTGAGDGSNRIFAGMQSGTVQVFANAPAVESASTFLDIADRIHYRPTIEGAEGFLGLAFHPNCKENGEFFVFYTGAYRNQRERRSVISRFRVSKDDPNVADPDSEEILLTIPAKYWDHNGGTLVFGRDGSLYIGLGDGGLRADSEGNGQDLGELWGKILRIDVDHKDPGLAYSVPQDNPFVAQAGARGEIWCYGIRNIWRMAFDRETGDLWAGDVGQELFEEIDLIVKGGNYGWSLREGFHSFEGRGVESRHDLIEPIWEYGRQDGKSVTGGVVYRGRGVPELSGAYLYADYVSGRIWALWYDRVAKRVTANRIIREYGGAITSFGEDDAGEVYFTSQDGGIFKFASPK